MKEYKCDKCGKNFSKNSGLVAHKNRKNPCDILIKNDNTGIINSDYIKKCLDECICAYCNKKFSQKGSVSYHMKNNCKKLKEMEEQKLAIFTKLKEEKEIEEQKKKSEDDKIKNLEKIVHELEKELKKTKSIISNTINNSNNNSNNTINTDNSINNSIINNNNNQQIVLVDYNKEDLSKIDKKEILAIMKRGFQAPVELTKTIHCNPKYPEFHNVFIPKINEKNGMIHIKDKWNLIDKNELSDDMYHRKRDFIIQNLEHYVDQLDEFKKKSLKRWLDTVDDDDEAIINTKRDIRNVLYENRALAMNQKKLLEKQKKQPRTCQSSKKCKK